MKTFAAMVCVFCFLFAFQPVVKSLQGAAAGTIQSQGEEKKEEEKKKETKKKKVITNEDLKNITGVSITYIEPDSKAKPKTKKTGAAKKTSARKKKPVDPKTTEKYWRDRWKKITDNIKKSEAKLKEMREKLVQMQLEHPAIDLMNERVKREEEMRRVAGSIQSYERGLKTLKKSLADLEDEARREGVPPGWLR